MPHYYMFHKPFGCVTARRDDRYPTVMDYFKDRKSTRLNSSHQPQSRMPSSA